MRALVSALLSVLFLFGSTNSSQAANWFTLCGEVYDELGNPLEGAEARLHGWGHNQGVRAAHAYLPTWQDLVVTTGSDGSYCFLLDPPVSYQFVIDLNKDGYVPNDVRFSDLGLGGQTQLTVDPVTLYPGQLFTGKLLPADPAQPLSSITNLTLHGQTSTASGYHYENPISFDPTTGIFQIPDLAPYSRILVHGDGVQLNEPTDWSGPGVPEYQLQPYQPENRLSIRIQDFTFPEPDHDYILVGGTKASDLDLDTLPFGIYTVESLDARYVPVNNQVDWQGGWMKLYFKHSGNVRVRVFDKDTGAAIPEFALAFAIPGNFRPRLYPRRLIGEAGPADEIYDNVAIYYGADYIIKADGYAPRVVHINSPAELDDIGVPGTYGLDVQLIKKIGSLSGSVIFPNGLPADGVLLNFVRKDYVLDHGLDVPPVFMTEFISWQQKYKEIGYVLKREFFDIDSTGTYLFSEIPDGTYTVTAYIDVPTFKANGGNTGNLSDWDYVEIILGDVQITDGEDQVEDYDLGAI